MLRRSILFLSVLLALAPVARSQDAPRHPGRLHHRLAKAGKQLGLTGAQREQVKSKAAQHEDEMAGMRQATKAARKELKRVLAATPEDAEAVRTAARSVSAARENLAAARAARRADVRSVLTPEQQAQVEAHKQQRAERHADKAERKAEKKAARKADRKAKHEGRKGHRLKQA
jgi:Spy/CpxP family protein refolding chaperone